MDEQDDTRSGMNYLQLVEEFPREPEITQFEKILVAAKRAKDLHDHDKVQLAYNHFTVPYTALQELREDIIHPVYREEEEPVQPIEDDSDDAEEEE